MIAPQTEGTYYSYWMIAAPDARASAMDPGSSGGWASN